MGDLALDDLEVLGQFGKAVADDAGMFFEQFPALACRGITRVAELRESPHLDYRHPGRPESTQERQPQEIGLLVSTTVPRAPDRFDEAGSLVVTKRVHAQAGPLSCLSDRDVAHGCQSRTWSALQVKPASFLAAEVDVAGLVLLAYPLHPPGKPHLWDERTVHWPRIACPVLLLSGEADPFANIARLRDAVRRLPNAKLVTYPRVRHGIGPVLEDAFDRVAAFLRPLAS